MEGVYLAVGGLYYDMTTICIQQHLEVVTSRVGTITSPSLLYRRFLVRNSHKTGK